MDGLINFRNVSFRYKNQRILEEVDLSIHQGDFVSVIGPNGGGKTTLVKLALGLLTPESGRVLLYGRKPRQTRALAGYIPQYSLFDPQFPVSVLDVVLMGKMGNSKFFFSKSDKEAALTAVSQVGLESVQNNAFSELSGGQRQRVLIARALISKPKLLIMDEPTASVDTAVEEKISTLLEKLAQDLTIIVITHDLGFVSHMVTKIVCVNKRVNIHPASEITKDHLENLYNTPLKAVRHDIKEKSL